MALFAYYVTMRIQCHHIFDLFIVIYCLKIFSVHSSKLSRNQFGSVFLSDFFFRTKFYSKMRQQRFFFLVLSIISTQLFSYFIRYFFFGVLNSLPLDYVLNRLANLKQKQFVFVLVQCNVCHEQRSVYNNAHKTFAISYLFSRSISVSFLFFISKNSWLSMTDFFIKYICCCH